MPSSQISRSSPPSRRGWQGRAGRIRACAVEGLFVGVCFTWWTLGIAGPLGGYFVKAQYGRPERALVSPKVGVFDVFIVLLFFLGLALSGVFRTEEYDVCVRELAVMPSFPQYVGITASACLTSALVVNIAPVSAPLLLCHAHLYVRGCHMRSVCDCCPSLLCLSLSSCLPQSLFLLSAIFLSLLLRRHLPFSRFRLCFNVRA